VVKRLQVVRTTRASRGLAKQLQVAQLVERGKNKPHEYLFLGLKVSAKFISHP